MGSCLNPGDLVEPHWKKGREWDYFDVLPLGYCTWKKGELGVVLSVTNRKPKKESSCEILHKGRVLIAYVFEMEIVSNNIS